MDFVSKVFEQKTMNLITHILILYPVTYKNYLLVQWPET